MKKSLYKFYQYCGRGNDLEGLFLATEDEVLSINGKEVCVYGKFGNYSENTFSIKVGDSIIKPLMTKLLLRFLKNIIWSLGLTQWFILKKGA